jgi:hypothetical protein
MQETQPVQNTGWETYHDSLLGIRISYPSGEYRVRPNETYTSDFAGSSVSIESVSIGDDMAEGQGIKLYRTKESAILDYLQQYQPFIGQKVVNGITYQQFEFVGMGDVYGYVTQKDGYYYIFESMWGPENPTSEKMLESLVFE